MDKRSQQGSVLIGVLLSLGMAAFLYVASSTSFFKTITKQKAKTELDVLSKSLTNAVFSYTSYAIKERWCMDANWGRDKSCGGAGASDMRSFVTHPRNLERFLWSKVTLNDMSLRYETTYKQPPAQALGLSRLEQNISISNLESLGVSHPLNLVMDDDIKKCLSSISIIIEKPLASYYKPQGDEVYLLITVKGFLSSNPLNRCSLIKHNPVLRGLVIFYPKTLNQYALIKADDFNISDYGNSTKGLDFYGPVYVQKNVIVPSSGKHSVSFKDKVRIGEGILKLDGQPFTPYTPGGMEDQYLSQITTMNGFMNGVSLEAEVDEGLPRLFGGVYTYPSNVNMAMCTNRKALKDNFSLTKNSRLWIRGSSGSYSFSLSESNEFREYIRHGANAQGNYIYNSYTENYENAPSAKKNTYSVNVTEETTKEKPIMEVQVSVDGREYSTIYMGRSSEAKITFGNKEFFSKQTDLLDTTEVTYLDINKVDTLGMGLDSSFKNSYDEFAEECRDARSDNIMIPECKKVDQQASGDATDCSQILSFSDRKKCEDTLENLKKEKNKYFSKYNSLISDLKFFITNTPGVVLKTSVVLSNKEDVKINFINKDSFKYPFVSGVDSIKFRFNVYDFAIEESNNTISGLRAGKDKRLPGPNEYGSDNENAINYEISRDKNGEVKKIETMKNDGTSLDSAVSSNWGLLKSESKSYSNPEPPGNFPFNSNIIYPVDGLTVAQAKELDEICDIDTTALPPASWDVSFLEHTQFSWLYNVTNPGITIVDPAQVQPLPSYTFTNLDMDVGNYQGVPTRSIVKECIVPNSIDFVFGFYVCETLSVVSRSRPLNLVGTFIVKNLKIDAASLSSGINFYSIWSSGGIQLLREKKHLRRERSANENCQFDQPGWFSGLTEDYQADYQSCSPAKFLYQGANNFNWTTIDPEIGITGKDTQVTTQSKVVNRYRRYGANVIWQRNGVE